MESALGTISGVKNVTATSAENYSLLLMEFEDDTDMNSAVVKVSNKVDQTTSSLPSTCMTPSIIEYTLNMNAFMTVAVSQWSGYPDGAGAARSGKDRCHQRKAAGGH